MANRTAEAERAEFRALSLSAQHQTADESIRDAIDVADVMAQLAALKSEIASLRVGAPEPVRATPAVDAVSSLLEEAVYRNDRARLEAAWAAEPTVRIRIEPTPEEKEYAQRANKHDEKGRLLYPARFYQVNGVALRLKVGDYTDVPQSIADLHERTFAEPAIDSQQAGEWRIGVWAGDGVPGA